jgi:hypothetical protein
MDFYLISLSKSLLYFAGNPTDASYISCLIRNSYNPHVCFNYGTEDDYDPSSVDSDSERVASPRQWGCKEKFLGEKYLASIMR